MQIELSEEVVAVLTSQAEAQGKSVSEVLSAIILRSVPATGSLQESAKPRANFDMDRYVRRMRAANPNYDTVEPRSVDWQEVKAEGRRY